MLTASSCHLKIWREYVQILPRGLYWSLACDLVITFWMKVHLIFCQSKHRPNELLTFILLFLTWLMDALPFSLKKKWSKLLYDCYVCGWVWLELNGLWGFFATFLLWEQVEERYMLLAQMQKNVQGQTVPSPSFDAGGAKLVFPFLHPI